DEVADRLEVSTSTVESLLFRARSRLRVQLRTALAGFSGVGGWIAVLRDAISGAGPGSVAAKAAGTGVGVAVLAVVVPGVVQHTSRPSAERSAAPAALVAAMVARPAPH